MSPGANPSEMLEIFKTSNTTLSLAEDIQSKIDRIKKKREEAGIIQDALMMPFGLEDGIML